MKEIQSVILWAFSLKGLKITIFVHNVGDFYILLGVVDIMHSKSEIRLLEICDQKKQVTLPERSELFSLEPIELGTGMCESLSSWISRLASLYGTTNGQFIRVILKGTLPLGNSQPLQNLNGLNETTLKVVSCLERKTFRTDLSYLTTLPWRGSFSSDQLLRKYKCWCPVCFENWKSQSLQIYEPLIWSFGLITICPIHKTRLSDMCPSCKKKNDNFSIKNKIGFCNKCGAWLGTENQKLNDRTIFETYTMQQIYELIKNASQMTYLPIRNRTSYLFEALLQDITEGNKKKLSRLCGLSLNGWLPSYLKGLIIPSFKYLIQISYSLSIPIMELLFSDLETHTFVLNDLRLPPKKSKRGDRGSIDFGKIEEHIDRMSIGQSPVITIKELCNDYGVSYYLLVQCLEEKTQQLVTLNKLENQKRLDESIRQVIQVTEELYNRGIYPSYRIVIKNTNGKLSFDKEIRSAYLQKIKQLGITQRVN